MLAPSTTFFAVLIFFGASKQVTSLLISKFLGLETVPRTSFGSQEENQQQEEPHGKLLFLARSRTNHHSK